MNEPLKLVSISKAALTSDSDMHGTALDLGPYVHVGKREMIGIWAPAQTGTDTDETYDLKFQESDGIGGVATTVTSDWSDITGAAFTQVAHDGSAFTGAWQSIRFVPTKRFINSLITMGGTTATIQNWVAVLVQKRFDT